MISLTFSSGPWGPKCLKYQNVPHLGSFWAIGKPWERFQRWDIIIYFIPVPKDHTIFAFHSAEGYNLSVLSVLLKFTHLCLELYHMRFITSSQTAQKPNNRLCTVYWCAVKGYRWTQKQRTNSHATQNTLASRFAQTIRLHIWSWAANPILCL